MQKITNMITHEPPESNWSTRELAGEVPLAKHESPARACSNCFWGSDLLVVSAAVELAEVLPKHFYSDDTSSQSTDVYQKHTEKMYIEKLELLVEKRHLRGCTEEAEERTRCTGIHGQSALEIHTSICCDIAFGFSCRRIRDRCRLRLSCHCGRRFGNCLFLS